MGRKRDFLRFKIHTKRENWGISFLSFVICPRTEKKQLNRILGRELFREGDNEGRLV